jgi:hypothetical protein
MTIMITMKVMMTTTTLVDMPGTTQVILHIVSRVSMREST